MIRFNIKVEIRLDRKRNSRIKDHRTENRKKVPKGYQRTIIEELAQYLVKVST